MNREIRLIDVLAGGNEAKACYRNQQIANFVSRVGGHNLFLGMPADFDAPILSRFDIELMGKVTLINSET